MAVSYRGFGSTPQLVAGPITATFTEVTAGTLGTLALSVPGSIPGMFFIVSAPALDADFAIVAAKCTTAGTVDLRIMHAAVGNATPTATSVYILGL